MHLNVCVCVFLYVCMCQWYAIDMSFVVVCLQAFRLQCLFVCWYLHLCLLIFLLQVSACCTVCVCVVFVSCLLFYLQLRCATVYFRWIVPHLVVVDFSDFFTFFYSSFIHTYIHTYNYICACISSVAFARWLWYCCLISSRCGFLAFYKYICTFLFAYSISILPHFSFDSHTYTHTHA